ncbi:MAG: protoporphyrinogen/coproporphyrinogen oxidase [Elusimicrobiota bacterium]
MKVVIIGAGLTGLRAAIHLQEKGADTVVLEKTDRPGGLTRTETSGDFKFDYTGHFLHFNSDRMKTYVKSLFSEFSDRKLLKVERNSRIFFHDRLVPYPFQSNIGYLPTDVKRECLVEFFKNLKKNETAGREKDNFYEWLYQRFGEGILNHFMVPYNKKLWTVHPKKLTTEWMSRFVPRPQPEEVIKGALKQRDKNEGYNATFFYPEDGIGTLPEILDKKAPPVNYREEVLKIDIDNKKVKTNTKSYEYDYLITTVPLKNLADITSGIPSKIMEKFKFLTYSSLLNINIGWDSGPGDLISRDIHWLYFPNPQYKFYRVGFPPAVSRKMAPEGCWSAYVEISYSENNFPDPENYDSIVKKVIKSLRNLKIIPDSADIINKLILKIEPSYVIYNKNWNNSRNTILKFLEQKDIFTGGRYGGWEYSTMEEALIRGEKLAEKCVRK